MPAGKKEGRPLKFQSVAEMESLVDAYFKECDKKKLPYTITGLAYSLDTTRHTLIHYEEGESRKDFLHTIKRAKAKIYKYAEESLWKSGIAAGVIFNLKNNWGWKDKTEVEHSGEMAFDVFVGDSKLGSASDVKDDAESTGKG